MEDIPYYVNITFIACVVATFGFVYYAVNEASPDKKNFVPAIIATFLCVWLFVVALLTFNGFFLEFDSTPPRMVLFGGFILLLVIGSFTNKSSRAFFRKMPITTLTYIHIIRVPIEIVLWWLYLFHAIPEIMTFEGMNYDIVSGISAPFAGLFLVGLKSQSRIAAIIWNLLALGLLLNVVIRAIMATPYFYDPMHYEQPNVMIFHFPFVWLPTFVVPMILLAHFVSLYKLIFIREES